MIICHCQNIDSDDVERTITWMRASDPFAIITPRKIYQALGKQPDCGGCLPHFVATMRKHPCLPVVPDLRSDEIKQPMRKSNER